MRRWWWHDCPKTLVLRVVTLHNLSLRVESHLVLLEMLSSFDQACCRFLAKVLIVVVHQGFRMVLEGAHWSFKVLVV